jgi:hypothetical protein
MALELRGGGWIAESGVVPLDQFENDLAKVALSFVGAAYLPGGRTWLGCDGPGFIQTACAACGIRIPRTLDQQVEFFEHDYLEVGTSQNSHQAVAVVYAKDLCGFQLGNRLVASRLQTMQVDVSSISEIYPNTKGSEPLLRIFELRP